MTQTKLLAVISFCALPIVAAGTKFSWALGQTVHTISQKGRLFGPSEVHLRPYEELHILNDDGDFVHDAYVDTPDFSFESGDINPGTSAIIAFPREGDYVVMCGFHPSMKLAVSVRSNSQSHSR